MRDAVLEFIRRVLWQAAEWFDRLIAAFLGEMFADPEFRKGFAAALVVGLLVGFASRYLLYWRRQIQGFFAFPTIVLSNRGPTPAQSYRSCMGGVAKLGLLAVVVFILLVAMLTYTSTP